jgi:hypothetical protein
MGHLRLIKEGEIVHYQNFPITLINHCMAEYNHNEEFIRPT